MDWPCGSATTEISKTSPIISGSFAVRTAESEVMNVSGIGTAGRGEASAGGKLSLRTIKPDELADALHAKERSRATDPENKNSFLNMDLFLASARRSPAVARGLMSA